MRNFSTQIDVQVIDPMDMTLLKLGELLEASSNFGPLAFADLVKSARDQDRQIASSSVPIFRWRLITNCANWPNC